MTTRKARPDGRESDQLRSTIIESGAMPYAEGSALITMGNTRVLCAASVEERIPQFRKGSGLGWVTAEYAMLPRSTHVRTDRDGRKGRVDGRASEIQRLIGRSLRAAVDLGEIGERTITIDCDVIQADGGTRTASITGAYVALALAVQGLVEAGLVADLPKLNPVAAVSVGIIEGEPRLDLAYLEDYAADTDLNCVGVVDGRMIEIQGTAEKAPFSRGELDELIDLATAGLNELFALQQSALKTV